ncbi:MAG TPA: hypothetical protein VHX61_05585 [Rhizomicrobium sp.]|jgi:transposase InsO family protein|nr:hypothetical protein [Rhizomicrobium sp.]
MEAELCLEAVEEALAGYHRPDIFKTDQGGQFICGDFVGLLLNRGIAVSMGGWGSCCDNVFVESLQRSVKYEEVHLRPTTASARCAPRPVTISTSTIESHGIRDLPGARPIKLTSTSAQIAAP